MLYLKGIKKSKKSRFGEMMVVSTLEQSKIQPLNPGLFLNVFQEVVDKAMKGLESHIQKNG